MKTITHILLFFAICVAGNAQVLNCANDSTGLPTLYDLGTGYYMGVQGGLYFGGSNSLPAGHLTQGQKIAKKIKALDSLGNLDTYNGTVEFISIGASITSDAWNNFKTKTNTYHQLNPCLNLQNGTVGGKGMEVITGIDSSFPDNWYIDEMQGKLEYYGVKFAQVQIAWMNLHTKDAGVDAVFPAYRDSLVNQMIASIQLFYQNMPNLKILYLTGIHYGGYTEIGHDYYNDLSEPAFYYNNLAVKKVIELQISGDPRLAYKGSAIKAPWLAWGPYFWADGTNPRAIDGLTWSCSDYKPEGGGYHVNTIGADKEGQMLFDFFSTNILTTRWFKNGPSWSACNPSGRLADGSFIVSRDKVVVSNKIETYPNPVNNELIITFPIKATTNSMVSVYSMQGDIVLQKKELVGNYTKVMMQGLPIGNYIVKVQLEGNIYTKQISKQ